MLSLESRKVEIAFGLKAPTERPEKNTNVLFSTFIDTTVVVYYRTSSGCRDCRQLLSCRKIYSVFVGP